MHENRTSPLDAYRAKRNPDRTPEPFGGGGGAAGKPLFVVHKHAARRLHYDLRLEMDGVLKSWAVPKGPSVRPETKRLAVHVEDHPIEYGDFEGVIPAGNYGAGAVIVWDRGWYRPVKEGDPLEQVAKGKLEIELFGFKLRGRWTLARMSKKDKEWLLLKKADGAAADVELTDRYPQSVVSGLTTEELLDLPAKQAAIRERIAALGAPRRAVPATQPVMLATLAERPFSGKGWLFEPKYDGVRVLASRQGNTIDLYARSAQVITMRYPELLKPLRALPLDAFLIDGEIVALDERGTPSFERLQARMGLTHPRDVEQAVSAVPVVAIFFDCLALDGHDLRRVPLLARKEHLRLLLPPVGILRYGDHVLEQGEAFFDAASAQRLEGIVAKQTESVYVGGRSRDWIKVKCQRRQEFVIGGYTDPQGGRMYFGALHLGVYEGPRLVYVSKVGTGFDERFLKNLWDQLQPLRRPSSPFATGTPPGRGHHWVEPTLVCEVRFTEWTQGGGIRHPVFLGLRTDKRPEECRREVPADAPALPPPAPARPADPVPEVKVTNSRKVFWPGDGYTKGDLIAYYDAVAPWLLPYLRDRPVVLTRYPDGIAGKSFYQKDAPEFAPAWVRTERIYSTDADREIDYFIVHNEDSLRYVVNLGTIPIHLWSARTGSLDRPDWLVLDLDPKGAPFTDVVTVARALHRILDDLDLPNYVKTSGATGLHIMVPLGARYTHDEARTFARLLATLGVHATSDIATLARPIRSRQGKVYVDFGQNGHGRTIVAPFAVRALPGAPASCPLRWKDVTPRLDPARYTINTLPARMKQGDPLAPILTGSIDMAAAIAKIETELGRE